MIKKAPNKYAYLIKIDYDRTPCPVCGSVGSETFEKLDYELICSHCSCVIETPYPYTSGVRFNKNLTFTLKKIQRDDKK